MVIKVQLSEREFLIHFFEAVSRVLEDIEPTLDENVKKKYRSKDENFLTHFFEAVSRVLEDIEPTFEENAIKRYSF